MARPAQCSATNPRARNAWRSEAASIAGRWHPLLPHLHPLLRRFPAVAVAPVAVVRVVAAGPAAVAVRAAAALAVAAAAVAVAVAEGAAGRRPIPPAT